MRQMITKKFPGCFLTARSEVQEIAGLEAGLMTIFKNQLVLAICHVLSLMRRKIQSCKVHLPMFDFGFLKKSRFLKDLVKRY